MHRIIGHVIFDLIEVTLNEDVQEKNTYIHIKNMHTYIYIYTKIEFNTVH